MASPFARIGACECARTRAAGTTCAHRAETTAMEPSTNSHIAGAGRIIDARTVAPPASPEDAVLAIGNFDGVHRGHQSLVARARREADARGLPCVIVTFDPHPRQVLRPDAPFGLVATVEERAAWLLQAGAHRVIVWPFDDQTRTQSPREFLAAIGRHARPRAVVHGPGFALGRARAGTADVLGAIGREDGFDLVPIEPLGTAGDRVSSSAIREAIERGDVEAAARGLGRWPTYSGIVVPGNRVGRTIGFPTANLEPSVPRVVPADGVYAAWVERWPFTHCERRFLGAVSVGDRPTFAGTLRLVEAFLLDFDDDLYGETLRLHLVARIRGQERFASVDDLVTQMHHDVALCRGVLSTNPV